MRDHSVTSLLFPKFFLLGWGALLTLLSPLPALEAQVAAPSPADAVKVRLEEANSRVRNGDLAGAIALLEPLRQLPEPSLKAVSLLAALYLESGRPQDALTLLTPLTQKPDADPLILFHAARAALGLERTAEAELYLTRAAAQAPTSLAAVRLAELRAHQGQPAEVVRLLTPLAEGEYAAAVVHQDRDLAARIAWLFARALLALGETARAVSPLTRLTEWVPADQEVWQLLGEALVGAGQIEAAQQALARAQTLAEQAHQAAIAASLKRESASKEADALLAQAFELHQRGQLEGALTLLHQVIELIPENPNPHLLEVRLLSELGRQAEALPKAEQLVQVRPDDPEALYLRGMLKLGLADPRGAEADLRQALSKAPNHVGSLNGLAMVAISSGRLEEAWALLQQVLALSPADPVAARNLIRIEQLRATHPAPPSPPRR